MKRVALICCAFVSVWLAGTIGARTASADWQYTKWGMKEAEVISASGGKAIPPTAAEASGWKSGDLSARLKAPYSTGKYGFTAVFYFDKNDELAMVSLNLIDTSLAHYLVGDLRTKYGNEADGSKSDVMEFYVWRQDSDQIDILMIGCCGTIASTSVSYKPRITDSNEGL